MPKIAIESKTVYLSLFGHVLVLDGDLGRADGDTLQDVRKVAFEDECEFVRFDVVTMTSESDVLEAEVASGSCTKGRHEGEGFQ